MTLNKTLNRPLYRQKNGSVFLYGVPKDVVCNKEFLEWEERLFSSPIHGILKNSCFSGFHLCFCDIQLDHPKEIFVETSGGVVTMRFVLEGECTITNNCMSEAKLNGNMHDIFYPGAQPTFSRFWITSKSFTILSIAVDPKHLLSPDEENDGLHRSFYKKIAQQQSTCLHEESFVINQSMKRIIHQISDNDKTGGIKRIYLASRIFELLRLQLEQSYSSEHIFLKYGIKQELFDKMHLCREFLEAHLGKPQVTLGFLARYCGTNEYTLKSGFKSVFGTTVFGYWKALKITKAKDLLKTSDMAIAEIAEQVGYKNQRHFSTSFKKIVGIPPKDFRKNPM